MASIVIAANDEICLSAQNWFIKNHGCLDGSRFDQLNDGDTVYIIAHDHNLGDGTDLIKFVKDAGIKDPGTKFNLFLIVCGAASMENGSDLTTPAERLANYFKRPVLASTTEVVGTWSDANGAYFQGNYKTVNYRDDVTSAMEDLSLEN